MLLVAVAILFVAVTKSGLLALLFLQVTLQVQPFPFDRVNASFASLNANTLLVFVLHPLLQEHS